VFILDIISSPSCGRGNMAEIPKADPDWRLHSVQWQM
jgi:hypothetical protein